jgi:hypothetical protein
MTAANFYFINDKTTKTKEVYNLNLGPSLGAQLPFIQSLLQQIYTSNFQQSNNPRSSGRWRTSHRTNP